MNIVKFEIIRNLKTTIIWTIAIVLIGSLYVAMGPTFTKESDALVGMLTSMGDDFLNGLGIDLDTFFSPIGFFSYIGGFIALAMAVQAMLYGLKAFVTEKNQQSIEFLYTKPKSRINIYFSKMIANIVLLTVTQVVVITALFTLTAVINDVDYSQRLMLLELATFIPIQYLFLFLGSAIGVSVNRLKNVVPVALLFCFGMFFLNMLSGVVDAAMLGNLSFFNYYNLGDVTASGSYDAGYVALTVLIIVVLFVYSIIAIKVRDLKVL